MIESPGFPDKYPHNLECSYMIIAPPHMDITLRFLTFDLENDPLLVGEGDCKYDWLDVWDGLPQGEGFRRTHLAIPWGSVGDLLGIHWGSAGGSIGDPLRIFLQSVGGSNGGSVSDMRRISWAIHKVTY